ncbi:hypothetical protein M758_12G109800 [Ceratodon purpureus]|nr:hypothetical protein M758_12G109800 [Ceratodon purpureus]
MICRSHLCPVSRSLEGPITQKRQNSICRASLPPSTVLCRPDALGSSDLISQTPARSDYSLDRSFWFVILTCDPACARSCFYSATVRRIVVEVTTPTLDPIFASVVLRLCSEFLSPAVGVCLLDLHVLALGAKDSAAIAYPHWMLLFHV